MAAPARRVSARLSAIAPSATLAVDARAKELKAAGRPVIGFGAGEPDFPTPDYIVEAAVAAARDPKNHRYSPAAGLPELREAIAAKTLRDSGVAIDAAQVLVTNGGKQAVYEALATMLDPGDEVLLPAPYWTTYPEAIRLAGGVPVEVFAGAEHGYKVTPEMLEEKLTDRTKAILHCSPSNPTGSAYTRSELKAITDVLMRHPHVWVLTDDMYEHLVYDDVDEWSELSDGELEDRFVELAGEAGLDEQRFREDMGSSEVEEIVEQHSQQAEDLELTGTPSFVADGRAIDLGEIGSAEDLRDVLRDAAEGSSGSSSDSGTRA